jgi:hypothetical protein
MAAVKDASGLYEVERRAYHAARQGFRIAELQISPTQKVPWHYHNNVHDTFYVIEGAIRIFLQDRKNRRWSSGARPFRFHRSGHISSPMLEKHLPCFSFSRASVSTTLFLSPESRLLAQNSNSLLDWRIENRTVAIWKHLTIPKRGP